MYIPSESDTEGMTRMEIWIVYWGAFTTPAEARRLAEFFADRATKA